MSTRLPLPRSQAIRRYPQNPIISHLDLPFSCRGVYNSTFIKWQGRYLSILRAEGYDLLDYFYVAESADGIIDWRVQPEPIAMPDNPEFAHFGHNFYDPRATILDDKVYITFCAHGTDARMALMSTQDFVSFEWEGFITGPGFRNTVLFPEKHEGHYMALERPNTNGSIWLTRSPDLVHWGQQKEVLPAGKHEVGVWGKTKIGPCGTPIRTSAGWLIIFHGVQTICDYSYLYHTGVMLTELERPWQRLRVGKEPILSPEEPYELAGHAPNVVFASSQIVEEDGRVKLYYGAADRYQCLAETTVDDLVHAALHR